MKSTLKSKLALYTSASSAAASIALFAPMLAHAQTIQVKRFILFIHFMGSAIISFFTFETVYSYFVSVKGYIPGVITGKLPIEYLEQLRPDVLEEDKDLLKR
jgi:formate dehydrogenase subunit gamma